MITYKFDIVTALKDKGYNTNRIRQEKIFPESTMTKFRTGKPVNLDTIDRLCGLLDCTPCDILEYKP